MKKKNGNIFEYPKGFNEITDKNYNRWVMAKASLRLQQAFNKNNEPVSYVRS